MPAKPFLDTNILIYAFSTEAEKSAVAEKLLEDGGQISVQVLNEFVNVSRRKLKLEWDEIETRIAILRALLETPTALTVDIHDNARSLASQASLSFFDAVILASASAANAPILYSEDLQHDRTIAGVTIKNPFI